MKPQYLLILFIFFGCREDHITIIHRYAIPEYYKTGFDSVEIWEGTFDTTVNFYRKEHSHFDNNLHGWVLDNDDPATVYYGAGKVVGHFGKSWYDDTALHYFSGGTSHCLQDIPQLASLHARCDSLQHIVDSLECKLHPIYFEDGSELDIKSFNDAIKKVTAAGGGTISIDAYKIKHKP
jgi:hypothetical protein